MALTIESRDIQLTTKGRAYVLLRTDFWTIYNFFFRRMKCNNYYLFSMMFEDERRHEALSC